MARLLGLAGQEDRVARLPGWRWLRRPADMFARDDDPIGADVDWAAFPWPNPGARYDRRWILGVLRTVIRSHPEDCGEAVTLVLNAVGNDHRGTMYPAAVAMTEQLLTIAENYSGTPRWVALTVLERWWGGWEPEAGFASYLDAEGVRVGVIPQIVQRVTEATGRLTRIATDDSGSASAALARDLLTVIPLGWGHTVDEGIVHFKGGRVDPDGEYHFPESELS